MTKNLFNHLKQHKPIIVNYGKGYFSDKDVREVAYFDDYLQKYCSETGVWGNALLRQIARGEVENTKIELGGENVDNLS